MGPREQRDFSLINQQDINMFSTEFLTDRNSEDNTNVLSQNILSTINYDPEDPGDLRLRLKVEDLVNRLNQERIFRSQNNGRPSQLTQLQYDFLLNHALQRDEPRYTGEDITSTNTGSTIHITTRYTNNTRRSTGTTCIRIRRSS